MSSTSAQCRAARALLNWSQTRLAEASKVATKTIADFELGKRQPYDRTIDDLRTAIEAAGVEFTNGEQPGVRLRLYRLKDEGHDAFHYDQRFIGFGAADGEDKFTVLVEDLALQRLEPKITGGAQHMWAFGKHRSQLIRTAAKNYDLGLTKPGKIISVLYDDIDR
jgi:transcriptional regulator with XRE-family HTH domain